MFLDAFHEIMRACDSRGLAIGLLGGCYGSSDFACAVRCDSEMSCPDGLTCSAPGELCGVTRTSCVPTDGASLVDAPPFECTPPATAHGLGLVQICTSHPLTPGDVSDGVVQI